MDRNLKNDIFFLFILSSLFILLSNTAVAVDSTSVTTMNANPFKYSYVLYQSPILYNTNNPTFLGVTTVTPKLNSKPLPSCKAGYVACVALHALNSNTGLSTNNCGITGFNREAKIYRKNGDITIDYKYGYREHNTAGGTCTDKLGNFHYTIMCIPAENVDPSTQTVQNGVGPICTT
jgi:hypothetical protein